MWSLTGKLGAKGKLKRSFVRVVLPPADLAPSAPSPLRVLQWNVLADGLAQHGDFIKVPSAALEWETRLPLILDEIEEASADICAIQELNRYEELRALLALRGYDGCFFPKHCSPASRYRCPADGLAIFYKKDRLEVAAQPAGTYFLDSKGRNMSQGFLRITLTDRLQGQQVVVVTTHLKAKQGQEMDSTRLSQVTRLTAPH
ncbi:endo/exonuclease/phosphatase domain-containing protein, partial [Haematococcus lacustris]